MRPVYLKMKDGKEVKFKSVADCASFFSKSRTSGSSIKSWILDDGLYLKPKEIEEIRYL
jgi:hypothetical protein